MVRGQPKVLLESFAKGTPVIASRLGSMVELVDEQNGLLFNPGDPEDLAATVLRVLSDPQSLRDKRLGTRRRFEALFTADRNYETMLAIYRQAIDRRTGIESGLPKPAYPNN